MGGEIPRAMQPTLSDLVSYTSALEGYVQTAPQECAAAFSQLKPGFAKGGA